MADEEVDTTTNRLHKLLNDVEKRVEDLRDNALAVQREKQSILEMLQDMQDGAFQQRMSEADRDDIEFNTERLILRCLTIEASVTTPRDDSQEQAFIAVAEIVEKLSLNCGEDPHGNIEKLVAYLNASLPEPLSSNIDSRFQSKLLGCTAEDQKGFRKQLQALHKDVKDKISKTVPNCSPNCSVGNTSNHCNRPGSVSCSTGYTGNGYSSDNEKGIGKVDVLEKGSEVKT
ncbi:BAG family molecular chaperone regulator 2-like [Mya arenaria]|uniref:BAG family molecular chaperone regulator 2-like n=1 Tax=Mya arenaria TaxID=6604 RepID=UPI0022E1D906|nr:BAG family molecular chaperone regulator 2-like [Mya arenaria]